MNIEIAPISFLASKSSEEEEKGYEAVGEFELEKFRLILEENNFNVNSAIFFNFLDYL
jgi:hypothetical protein